MDTLGVIRPNFVTRVTEFVPQIVQYIQKIIQNGFAYVSPSGSVYFDVPHFSKHHTYAKLVPESATDLQSLAEGEGSLTFSGDKRSSRDFALWKASKDGEPSWDSPWSKGRPGWHIECSVMATCVFGPQMDIHSGGCDLKFPHHDNEIAQAEAYFDGGCWVRNFWHSGHLTINGCKMSKSLKNFITIESALEETSPRRLRLLFLLHVWNQPFDYSPDALNEALTYEKHLMEFLLTAKSFCRRGVEGEEDLLKEALIEAHKLFRKAMCDSFNTRQALNDLKSLVSVANSFINSKMSSPTGCDSVRKTADFIIGTLNLFGVVDTETLQDFSIFRTTLSPTSIMEDMTPFINVIEHTLNLFLPPAHLLHKLVSELETGNSEDNLVSKLVVAVKSLLICSQKTVDSTLSDLFLNVEPLLESVKLWISESDLVGCMKDHKNFESLACKYVECVSQERDHYRYTCIGVLKLIKQIRRTEVAHLEVLKSVEESVKTLLGVCDVVRKDLLELGVKLEDFSGGVPAAIKFYDLQLL